ncbi:MAG: hypothetical protein ACKOOG_15675, partial [Actinomycetota bacterium]
ATGAASGRPAADPRKRADPRGCTPPAAVVSQNPAPSGAAAIPRPARRAARLVDLAPSVTGRGFLGCWGNGEVTAHGDAVSLGGAKGKLASAAVGIAGRVSGA